MSALGPEEARLGLERIVPGDDEGGAAGRDAESRKARGTAIVAAHLSGGTSPLPPHSAQRERASASSVSFLANISFSLRMAS